MIVPEREYFRPLCPAHHTVMLTSPDVFDRVALPDAWDTPDRHDCECSVDGCPHHYSPGCGYFTLEPNVEHQKATGSAALRMTRSATQVICYQHKYSMFLVAFDRNTGAGNFRCPEKDCRQTMTIQVDGPPAYWLGDGYFKRA
jgi:hypothetical protein